MGAYAVNQYAPDYFAGRNQPPPSAVQYQDKPFEYTYSPPNGQLTANQTIGNDIVSIDSDADFILRGWYISQYTGAFQIQLTDANGYQLSSGQINSGALSRSSSDPTVFSPEHPFPASGRIMINITDLSGATNALQIVFKGVKRYRTK